jgi:hypothetical protein
MGISKQIGWSQESNLIYQIVKQTEYINKLLPTSQSYYTTRVSKMIGWSTEANLYYEWLRSLDRLTQHYANCCAPITTTTTTTGFVSREWCMWSGDSNAIPRNYLSEYAPLTNQLTDLKLGVNDFPAGTEFFGASTAAKVWKFAPFEGAYGILKEWGVNSYPASLIYIGEVIFGPLGVDYTVPSAICAYDNNHLLMVFKNNAISGIFRTVLYNLTTQAYEGIPILDYTANFSKEIVSIMFANTNKLITVEQRPTNDEWFVRQYSTIYNPDTGYGYVEAQLSLSSIPTTPTGKYYVFNYKNEVYLARTDPSSLYKINLAYPQSLTEINPNLGWSPYRQYWSSLQCNVAYLEPSPTCGTSMPPLGGSVTYFGNTVTLSAWSGSIYNYGFYVSGFVPVCTNFWLAPYSWTTSGPGSISSITLTFSAPVNDVLLRIAVFDYGDSYTFLTNVGDPIITSTNSCYVTMTGNQVISDIPPLGLTGSGEFKVTAPTDFTTLTIDGINYGNGVAMSFACDPSVSTTTTTSTSTTLPPSGINTIYTTFDIL